MLHVARKRIASSRCEMLWLNISVSCVKVSTHGTKNLLCEVILNFVRRASSRDVLTQTRVGASGASGNSWLIFNTTLINRSLMVHGSWLNASRARAWGTQRQFLRGHEPWTTSLETWARSLEPWAMSHEPWTNIIDEGVFNVSNFQSLKVSSFQVPGFQSLKFPNYKFLKRLEHVVSNIFDFRDLWIYENMMFPKWCWDFLNWFK